MDLTKQAKVNLTKGTTLNLVKEDGNALTKTRLALGWDAVKKKGLFGSRSKDIDLDASIIALNDTKDLAYTVFYGSLNSWDHAVLHSGDNLTGAGEGDDEVISVDLSRVDPRVKYLACVITSYSGQTFEEVENVFCRLDDMSASRPDPVAAYNLKDSANARGMVMAVISRVGNGWSIEAKGIPVANARTPRDLEVVRAVQASI